MDLLLYAIPFFLISMAAEWWYLRHEAAVEKAEANRAASAHRGYLGKDTAASLSLGVGYLINKTIAYGAFVLAFWAGAFDDRLFDIPMAWWSWLLLLVVEDFIFYWYHRSSHEVRALWALHVNHHSSTHYNLSTALRQPALNAFFVWVFWLPLPFIGFPLEMIATQMAISLLYQYWLHTELIDSRGWRWFGFLFNTPSHHRVHHGRNAQYLDRNYGGILIIWDRLFGTFEPEGERVKYGIYPPVKSYNPIRIVFHEWVDIFRDMRKATTWRGRLGYFLGRPGWREDGSGVTAKQYRRQWESKRAAQPTAPPTVQPVAGPEA
ncbi:sterol desaturase family protein [bacterium]|nr:sterol desaturase family protein [bacterium]MCB9476724.1 sterol desaturase family protein [Deltaproteobacteria bacterium]